MSGFAGVLRTDGAPIDSAVFDRFLPILRQRGPDGDGSWMDPGIGFGYSDLKIEDRRPHSGPFLLSDQIAIVGDVRLDARDELIGALASSGLEKPAQQPDLKLILRAYRKWGDRCLEHLRGDFSFALWDREEKRVFCARDHFGVRPFYYGAFGDTLVFSNTLACLLIFEELAAALDESAIGEYLLFGQIRRLDRTPFSKIQRLSPAHLLFWSAQTGIRTRRYWSLVPKETAPHLKKNDVLHQFEHRMHLAVSDRMPASEALVMMSGGLDSTCVAAFAKEIAKDSSPSIKIHACTFFYQELIEDHEKEFAQIVADALHIPLQLINCDKDILEWSPSGRSGFCPEPTAEPPISASIRQSLDLLRKARVGFTGQGGDPDLHPRPRHPGGFFKSLFFGGLGKAILQYRNRMGAFPRMGLRSSIRNWLGRPDRPREIRPLWIAPDFFKRCDLAALQRQLSRPPKLASLLRAEAYHFVTAPFWPSLFEHDDAGATGVPAQFRHPFFDLRLVTFLLSLPPVPWCVDKHILREGLKDRLPARVLSRPKTPLSGYPPYEMIRKAKKPLSFEALIKESGVERFVDKGRYLHILLNSDKIRPEEYELITRPLGLAWWLTQQKLKRVKDPFSGGNHG